MNAMAMVTRCMVRQPPNAWADNPDHPSFEHHQHGEVAQTSGEWPNLMVWTGSRHMPGLTVKQ